MGGNDEVMVVLLQRQLRCIFILQDQLKIVCWLVKCCFAKRWCSGCDIPDSIGLLYSNCIRTLNGGWKIVKQWVLKLQSNFVWRCCCWNSWSFNLIFHWTFKKFGEYHAYYNWFYHWVGLTKRVSAVRWGYSEPFMGLGVNDSYFGVIGRISSSLACFIRVL
jgi:hypothetical protein